MTENKTLDSQIILGGDAHLDMERKGSFVATDGARLPEADYENKPTEEERASLRRVAGKVPMIAYLICIVEFSERASYYGVQPLFGNFVNRKLPPGGNGYGAPPAGSEATAGALGMGSVKATAVTQSFNMLTYTLPVLFGYLADTRTGRYKMIMAGVFVCGVAHVLMCAAGAKSLLATGNAKIPFFISVYVLSMGAAMFKPNISPTLLDQMKGNKLMTKVLKTGEKVLVDPEHTTERVMLWFYLLINIGGFMNVPTSYTAKYVGWWLSFVLPLILYLPLPFLLMFLKKRLVLHPPGGSDLVNCFRVIGISFRRGGFMGMFKKGFFNNAKPSVIALSGSPMEVPWNDAFVDDVRRSMQATGIFCFFPIQIINDQGLGNAANTMSSMLTTKGVPNDVIGNFNSLSIIVAAPILNYGLYPFLRARGVHYGPVARMTTGLLLAACGGVGYCVLNYYAYKIGPCGSHGTSLDCVDADDNALTSNISIWYMAIPYAIGGVSELFVNVPAYGIAYSRAPKNMRGFVSSLNLFSSAIAYALNLALAGVIRDPFLTWDFGIPAIIGFILTAVFWWLFRHLDNEEYTVSENDDYEQHVGRPTSVGSSADPHVINEKTFEDKETALPTTTAVIDHKTPESKEIV
ncbi:peptide transporter [Amylocarpus encephaloides]|uniref:Peptide transporter n=1 Tax=Amylocarpus encephaloides TaxID=45428 RepID=A0A9P7YAA0_9HELO|nr:peptide transporter [Amylocarpus encephaloides]